jgi:hypothetical protein
MFLKCVELLGEQVNGCHDFDLHSSKKDATLIRMPGDHCPIGHAELP